LGPGGSVLMQGQNISIDGGLSIAATSPTVQGGSITFVTQPQGVPILITPIGGMQTTNGVPKFNAFTWSTQAGLNIGNGNGVVISTSATTLIDNPTGDVDVAEIFTSPYQSLPGNLVVLASGNIINSGVGTPFT